MNCAKLNLVKDNMDIKKHFKGIRFFWKGLKAAKTDMWASLQVLVIATLILGTVLYFVEHTAQPEVYAKWYDPYLWGMMSYLGNPGKFSPGEPITLVGRWIAIIISIIKILIFAVPAGLVANGFRAAMAKEKRSEELVNIHKRLLKKFNRISNKPLRDYLNTLPNKGGDKLKVLNFVPRNRPLSTLQMQMGIGLQDLFDTARAYPEFRIHNTATAKSTEDNPTDRFVMECFPVNASYGCCINRDSNITIISTSSFDENGIGWWTYYLALFGGFNYVSKDLEVDLDDIDSFFNMSDEPTYEKKTKDNFTKDDDGYDIIEKKTFRRRDFMKDIHKLLDGKQNTWVLLVNQFIKTSENPVDLHLAINNAKNDKPSVKDAKKYECLYKKLFALCNEMEMECVNNSRRYPLLKKNLIYRLQEKENIPCNGVCIRPSTDIVNFGSSSLVVAFRIANAIGQALSSASGIPDEELIGLKPGYGYNIRD